MELDAAFCNLFRQRYIQFLNQLEQLNQLYPELTDTDVRERLYQVLNFYFVWGHSTQTDFPQRYALFTPASDEQLKEAVQRFVVEAQQMADAAGVPVGEERYKLLEDDQAISGQGHIYWWFLGSSDTLLPMKPPTPDEVFDYEEEEDDTEENDAEDDAGDDV